jgi:CelD/BcsL family acetyltransferase involved in cellulose biosynthesis
MGPTVRLEQFDEVQDDWEECLPRCFTNTIFVTPWLQRVWWRVFGVESELRILTLRDGGAVVGIAPMLLKEGVLTFLGGSDLFDYHDFLVPKGNEDTFYEGLLDHLETMEWHTIDLRSLPHDSPTVGLVPALAERKGYSVEVSEEDVVPFATLPSTWEEFVSGLPKKDRHELRRKMRRLDSAGAVSQHTCQNGEAVRECMQDFFRLHRVSRPDKARFMIPERERFFMDAALELGGRGQLNLAILELDGQRVASCLSFDYLDSRLLYNSGYDPDYSKLSVGLVNKALAIKEAIEEGKQTFDFLRGAERYKYDLGAKDRPVYQLVVRR